MINSLLLVGQSNMCGRGIIGTVPEIDPRGMMFMLRNGRWQIMSEPICTDRQIYVKSDSQPRSGVSLAASFAEEYYLRYNEAVGLIPASDGGTSLEDWEIGGVLFDNAVFQAKLASRSSSLAGILWHQGESDAHNADTAARYYDKFLRMIDALRVETGMTDKPVVLGELYEPQPSDPYTKVVNDALHRVASERADFAIASASGLSLSPDGIHFSAESYRVFGRRYFKEYSLLKEKSTL